MRPKALYLFQEAMRRTFPSRKMRDRLFTFHDQLIIDDMSRYHPIRQGRQVTQVTSLVRFIPRQASFNRVGESRG